MAQHSKIEWTESTWNPVTGCTKVSAGCKNCYAERMAKRLHAMGCANYRNGFKVTLHPHALNHPLKWRQPQSIFVNSMSDLFHEAVPDEFITDVFKVMEKAYWHRFQVLTKRSERLLTLNRFITWPENVWMGVTVENSDCVHRIEHLRNTGAGIKFLSLEPLLGPLDDLNLKNIDWVIAGGESGPGSRPIMPDWIRGLRDQCILADIPFFFKQWGGVNKKKNGRIIDSRTWNQMPNSERRSRSDVQPAAPGG